MLIGRVVQDEVGDDADIALLGLRNQAVEIGHRAVLRVDSPVVRNVIPEIDLWRGIERRDPDGVDAEFLEIIQMLGDAIQVADSVSVCICEAAGINFVNYGALPPLGRGSQLRQGDDESGKNEPPAQENRTHWFKL